MDWSSRMRPAVDIKIWKELQTLACLVENRYLQTPSTFSNPDQCNANSCSFVGASALAMRGCAGTQHLQTGIFKARALLSQWEEQLSQVCTSQALLKTFSLFLLLFELGCCGAAISDAPPALLMGSSMRLGHQSVFKRLYSSYQMQTRHFRHFKCSVAWTFVVYHLNCDQQCLRCIMPAHKQLNWTAKLLE